MKKYKLKIQWLLGNQAAILYLFYFICFSAFSQNQYSTFSSIVLQASDKTPIDDVSIYFENTAVGTISNENGKFELRYKSSKLYDYLIISKIGYTTLRLKFSEIQQNSPIYLNRESISLDEVVIIQNKVEQTAEEIVETAFKNLPKNLSSSAYLSTGYIRHTERLKNKYKYLKEAIFTLYDPGFQAHPSEINLNLNYTKKAIDNRELDTIVFYTFYLEQTNLKSLRKNYKRALNYKKEDPTELKKAMAFYDNTYTLGYHKKYGLLKNIFVSDINKIRYFNRKEATFSTKNLNDFSFKLDTIFSSENDLTYKIKFLKKEKKKGVIHIGYLFINKEDYAIAEVQHTEMLPKGHHYREFSGKKIRNTSVIKYRKINNYYYPIYMSYKRVKVSNKILTEEETKKFAYYSHEEILLSDIVTDESIVKETVSKQNNWDNNLFEDKNNTDDWGRHNFLLESTYEVELRKDLEIESLKNKLKKGEENIRE